MIIMAFQGCLEVWICIHVEYGIDVQKHRKDNLKVKVRRQAL